MAQSTNRRKGFLDYGGCGCCLLVPLLAPVWVPLYILFNPVVSAFNMKPEDIDVSVEKAKMKSQIQTQIVGLVALAGILCFFFYIGNKTSYPPIAVSDFYPIVIFSSLLLVLCVTSSVLKYLVLRYKAKSRK